MSKTIEERLKDHNMTRDDFRKILEDMGDDYVGVLSDAFPRKDGRAFLKKNSKFKICKKCEAKNRPYQYKILNEYQPVVPNGNPPGIGNLVSEMQCSNGHKWEFEHEGTGEI